MIHLDPTFSDLLMFILLDIKVRRPPSMLLPYRQGGVPFIVLRVVELRIFLLQGISYRNGGGLSPSGSLRLKLGKLSLKRRSTMTVRVFGCIYLLFVSPHSLTARQRAC